jgi:hypothetical protein
MTGEWHKLRSLFSDPGKLQTRCARERHPLGYICDRGATNDRFCCSLTDFADEHRHHQTVILGLEPSRANLVSESRLSRVRTIGGRVFLERAMANYKVPKKIVGVKVPKAMP